MMTRRDNLFLTLIEIAAFAASLAQWGSIALMLIGGAALLFGKDETSSLLLVLALVGYVASVFCYRLLARAVRYYVTRAVNPESR